MGHLTVLIAVLALLTPISQAQAEQPCPERNPATPLLEPVQDIARQLAKPLFQTCFQDNSSEIPAAELNELFENARKDPFTHMKTPEIHCLHRAYILLGELYQKGYRARLLHIEQSPTLIGLVNFNSCAPTHYVDYKGQHWVVAVDVRGEDGRLTPEILDPQFMQAPMKYGEYFMQTAGQVCHPGAPRGKWDCNYREINPRSFTISQLDDWFGFRKAKGTAPTEGCSWPLDADVRKEVGEINQWTFTTTVPLTKEVLELNDAEKEKRALILQGYENRRRELEEEIQSLKNFIAECESAPLADAKTADFVRTAQQTSGPVHSIQKGFWNYIAQSQIDEQKKVLARDQRDLKEYNTHMERIRHELEQPAN